MAFTVEDGTGVAAANALIDAAFYRDYHTTRGRTVVASPTLPDTTIEGWIVRSTDYIVKRFGTRFRGTRTTLIQGLPFPREGITVDGVELASDALPVLLKQAVAEYALRASEVAELSPDAPLPFDHEDAEGGTIEGSGPVTSTTVKVGPIEEAKSYAGPRDVPTSPRGSATVSGWMLPTYPAADLLIEPLLLNNSGKVIRN